jgi:hypothetical protein
MSCNAEISKALIKQALSIDDSCYDCLITAWLRDHEGELPALSDDQFELILEVDDNHLRSVLFSCAVDVIRMGCIDVIDEYWVESISIYQSILVEKTKTILDSADGSAYLGKLSELREMQALLQEDFFEQTGHHLTVAR